MPQPQQLTIKQAISRAKKATKRGNTAVALELYNAVLLHQPNHRVAKENISKLQKKFPQDRSLQVETKTPSQDQINALVTLYHSGQMIKTEQACRELLQTYTQSLVVVNILGAALQGQGKFHEAVESYDSAIQLKPDFAEAYNNRGAALKEIGQMERAVKSYEKAIQLKPDYAEAYHNRGNALKEIGQMERAVKSYEKAIQLKPGYAEAYHNRGNALKEIGQMERAVKSYEKVIQLKPDYAEAYHNCGIVLKEIGQNERAVKSYEKAIQLKPDYAEAYHNRGIALKGIGQMEWAVESYEKAIQLKPDFAEAYNNRGNVLKELGQMERAMESYEKAIHLKSDYAEAYNNRGNALKELGQNERAVKSYEKAIHLKPDFAEAYNNRGAALQAIGQMEQSFESYEKAIHLKSDYAEAYNNRGNALKEIGQNERAVKSYEKAIHLKPNFLEAHSNLLFILNYLADQPSTKMLEEARHFGDLAARQALPYSDWRNAPESDQGLRVGLVSGDLRIHSVGFFVEGILAALASNNSSQLKIIVYQSNFLTDALTERVKTYCHGWHSVVGVSDENLAWQIRDDGIDILIDLSGHTAFNRLPMFAWKPAPVQVSCIGYPNTTGLSAIDYRFVDGVTDPPGDADRYNTEKLIRLPHCFLCYRPPLETPAIKPPPCVDTKMVTFGSLNNLAKISPQTISAWAALLKKVPDASLILKSLFIAEEKSWKKLIQEFAEQGIDPDRIKTFPKTSRQFDHLDLYNKVDIALDTFPYNGTTTTCEALWMGVPVIALLGDRHAARVSASLLKTIGLSELVAQSSEDFVKIGTDLAQDVERLKTLRYTMRTRMHKSPLQDEKHFASIMEQALRKMWEIWCNGEAPRVFEVTSDKTYDLSNIGVETDPATQNLSGEDEPVITSYLSSPADSAIELNIRGEELFAQRKLQEAEENHPIAKKGLRKLVKNLPRKQSVQTQISNPTPEQINALTNLYYSGQITKAEQVCKELLQTFTQSLIVINVLGAALKGQGKLQEAVQAFDKAIQLKPEYAEAYSNRGVALKELGQLKEAVDSYNKAIQLKPEYAEAYSNRGVALKELGQLKEAVDSYNKAIRIKPDHAEAYSNRGNALKELGQLKKAVDSYNKAIQIKPEYAEAYYNRGVALKKLGQLKKAVNSYNKAIQIKPDHAEDYYNRGNALKELKQLKEAVDSYNKAIQIKPDYAEAYSNRGVALKELGQLKEAVDSYNKAIQIKPDYAEAYSNRGVALNELGQLKEAVDSCNKAIQIKPDYAEAYTNRGVALNELGQLKEAVDSYNKAIQIKPDHAEAYYNRGNALKELGQLKEAVDSCNKAIQIKPDYAEAYSNRGVALKELGQLKEAVNSYNKAIQIKPDYAEAYYNRGNAHKELGQLKEAVDSCNKAIQIKPDYAEAYYNRGNAHKEFGQLKEAVDSYNKAIQIKPDYAEAYSNCGNALNELGQLKEAVDSYNKAIQIKPDYAEVYYNRGNALNEFGQLKEAVDSYNKAIQIKPDYADAYCNRGVALRALGQLKEAVRSCDKAIQLKPDYAEAYNNCGNALKEIGQMERALKSYEKAIQLKPDFAEAYNNRGNALKEIDQLEQAVESYEKAVQLKPDYHEGHSNLLLTLNYLADQPSTKMLEEARHFGDLAARQALPYRDWHKAPESDQRLRVGLVSGDLRIHSVGFFVEGILAALASNNSSQLKIIVYQSHSLTDALTERVKTYCHGWHSVVGVSDENLARQIRHDGIDILIDLSGHTAFNRLPMFAWKPAPVQVSWIGYPNTTGLSAIDYRFVDSVTDPPGDADRYHTKKLIRLPHCFLCYRPPLAIPAIKPPPCVDNKIVTFGSFNNPAKISPQTISAWAALLKKVPDATLILKSLFIAEEKSWKKLIQEFAEQGIDPDRIKIFPKTSRQFDHLDLYNKVDIALDTFPYNGTTTTCEALWMGVPVIALLGNRHAARVSASLLKTIGLSELVAQSSEDFVKIGADLAQDVERLKTLRYTLRTRMHRSPLQDEKHFASILKQALRKMWEIWYNGEAPRVFEVTSDKTYDLMIYPI